MRPTGMVWTVYLQGVWHSHLGCPSARPCDDASLDAQRMDTSSRSRLELLVVG